MLPLFETEQTWAKPARAFLYFMLLCWCFLGVSIIADVFMGAIEAVTSKRKLHRLACGMETIVKVWNPTVANLTLMALGSSAPEILLSVIELLGNKFYAGELGPSTIVGSAAFNQLVIIAICVWVIPHGESRTILQPVPFLVTAAFSELAYLWLMMIVAISTPDLIDIWEGVLTLFFFPILVVIAYLADIGKLSRTSHKEQETHRQIQAKMMEAGIQLTTKEVKLVARAETGTITMTHTVSRASRRSKCGLVSGNKTIAPKQLSVGFAATRFSLPAEGCRPLVMELEKIGLGALDARVGVEYSLCMGGASSRPSQRGHFDDMASVAEIPSGQMAGQIKLCRNLLPIRSRDLGPEDTGAGETYFFVELVQAWKLPVSELACTSAGDLVAEMNNMETEARSRVPIVPNQRKAQVVVTRAEGRGEIGFESITVDVSQVHEDRAVKVMVNRTNGCSGEVACRYQTEPDSAKPIYDYIHAEGELVFESGVMQQTIDITILRKGSTEASDRFFVTLCEIPDKPATIVKESSICAVTVIGNSVNGAVGQMVAKLDNHINFDAWRRGNADWKEQWVLAFRPGDGDVDSVRNATPLDWTVHFIALPWKVFFALVPPPSYMRGWLCFCIALAFIGVVTAIIGDLAALMGCCIGLPDSVTAITIVALGTSLPDAFASKVAAIEDPTADNAIGNVTGSNSVNVFLGLGLPWMMAAIFWKIQGRTTEWVEKYPDQAQNYPDGGFVVVGGDLTFSVVVFLLVATCALCAIWYRRTAFKAELGGPTSVKLNTVAFFLLLWFFYIGLASWKVFAGDVNVGTQIVAVMCGMSMIVVGMLGAVGVMYLMQARDASHKRAMKEILSDIQVAGARGRDCRASTAEPDPLHSGRTLTLPETVARLRSHIDGLRMVCTSIEGIMSAEEKKKKRASGPDGGPRGAAAAAATEAATEAGLAVSVGCFPAGSSFAGGLLPHDPKQALLPDVGPPPATIGQTSKQTKKGMARKKSKA